MAGKATRGTQRSIAAPRGSCGAACGALARCAARKGPSDRRGTRPLAGISPPAGRVSVPMRPEPHYADDTNLVTQGVNRAARHPELQDWRGMTRCAYTTVMTWELTWELSALPLTARPISTVNEPVDRIMTIPADRFLSLTFASTSAHTDGKADAAAPSERRESGAAAPLRRNTMQEIGDSLLPERVRRIGHVRFIGATVKVAFTATNTRRAS